MFLLCIFPFVNFVSAAEKYFSSTFSNISLLLMVMILGVFQSHPAIQKVFGGLGVDSLV